VVFGHQGKGEGNLPYCIQADGHQHIRRQCHRRAAAYEMRRNWPV
jgi:hypothetical protein